MQVKLSIYNANQSSKFISTSVKLYVKITYLYIVYCIFNI